MLRRITPLGQRFLTRKATLPSATSALSRRTLASDTAVTSNDQQQAPNRMDTWSENQADRATAMSGPRFEQTDMSAQVGAPLTLSFSPSPLEIRMPFPFHSHPPPLPGPYSTHSLGP